MKALFPILLCSTIFSIAMDDDFSSSGEISPSLRSPKTDDLVLTPLWTREQYIQHYSKKAYPKCILQILTANGVEYLQLPITEETV